MGQRPSRTWLLYSPISLQPIKVVPKSCCFLRPLGAGGGETLASTAAWGRWQKRGTEAGVPLVLIGLKELGEAERTCVGQVGMGCLGNLIKACLCLSAQVHLLMTSVHKETLSCMRKKELGINEDYPLIFFGNQFYSRIRTSQPF